MPFKEHDHEIQYKVNVDTIRQNVKMIKIHARQLEHENKYNNPVEKLNNLFRRKEDQ